MIVREGKHLKVIVCKLGRTTSSDKQWLRVGATWCKMVGNIGEVFWGVANDM
jgi:hypothetical protein